MVRRRVAPRARRLHPRPPRLSPPRAGGGRPGADPAARDRVAGRGRAGAAPGDGARRRHGVGRRGPGDRLRASGHGRRGRPTSRRPRSSWRARTRGAWASPSGSSSPRGRCRAMPRPPFWSPTCPMWRRPIGTDSRRRSCAGSPAARSSRARPDWRRSSGCWAKSRWRRGGSRRSRLEVGIGQAEAVGELVRRAGFERVEAREDLAGIERVVVRPAVSDGAPRSRLASAAAGWRSFPPTRSTGSPATRRTRLRSSGSTRSRGATTASPRR